MVLKRNYLWILFFGSVIGLNEILIGSVKIPYHSVVLSTVTLTVLTLARFFLPKRGTSMLIILIAVLFKIIAPGIQCCTTAGFLCGPTALLLLGTGFEIFASLFISGDPARYWNYFLTCAVTSVVIFAVFAVLQTYILRSWDQSRFIDYTIIRGPATAVVSGIFSMAALYITTQYRNITFTKQNPFFVNGILGSVVIAIWFLGIYIG